MKEFEFIGKSVWLKKQGILVIADVHIGFEESFARRGVLLPRGEYKIIKEDMKKITENLGGKGKINEIIILGDLKHEFGEISSQEWHDVIDFLEFLGEKCERIVLVKGNHDKILAPIAEKRGLEARDYYISGENCFIHGDKMFPEVLESKVKRIFLGHMHPAITIKEDVKSETYKCFLVGKWKSKEIIILPSFFPLTEGSDIEVEDNNLALDLNLKNFEVYVPILDEDKVLKLGKAKNAGELM